MKSFKFLYPFIILVILCSCEVYPEAEEVVCLPTNMTATVIQGANTAKIIADFHYVPDSDLLDHITWSNHQTHYFSYDESDRLVVVQQLKVKEKVQEEMWFEYDGELITKVKLVKKNLDFTYLEPMDSTYTGQISFTYEGMNVISETRYEIPKGGNLEVKVKMSEYQYDGEGNIINSAITWLNGEGEDKTVNMTYDSGKHPYSGLKYYFNGESFVNNVLTRSSGFGDTNYEYDLRVNGFGYPETIYEKLGSSNTRIIRYTYECI
jgi:hypothetical protein